MVIRVVLEDCIGCGVCSQICPQVFDLDEDAGKVRVSNMDSEECVQEAVDSCPVSCIFLEK